MTKTVSCGHRFSPHQDPRKRRLLKRCRFWTFTVSKNGMVECHLSEELDVEALHWSWQRNKKTDNILKPVKEREGLLNAFATMIAVVHDDDLEIECSPTTYWKAVGSVLSLTQACLYRWYIQQKEKTFKINDQTGQSEHHPRSAQAIPHQSKVPVAGVHSDPTHSSQHAQRPDGEGYLSTQCATQKRPLLVEEFDQRVDHGLAYNNLEYKETHP
ncbi:hypothetical protein DM02DRAFT_48758 [Periconia macrospinosa]|uniref:Uncharacterized protein n=1 Tax=Periconia macrospinosa TaxID=97972 RepID=A0A2V1DKK0_9PLEO|nr:hypothetical protein DM02DRAFT_48758 [Periconia macrospinosa]